MNKCSFSLYLSYDLTEAFRGGCVPVSCTVSLGISGFTRLEPTSEWCTLGHPTTEPSDISCFGIIKLSEEACFKGRVNVSRCTMS